MPFMPFYAIALTQVEPFAFFEKQLSGVALRGMKK